MEFNLLLHRNPVQIRLAWLSFVVNHVARAVLEPGAQHHRTPVVGTEHFLLWATSAVLQISVNEANYPARCTAPGLCHAEAWSRLPRL